MVNHFAIFFGAAIVGTLLYVACLRAESRRSGLAVGFVSALIVGAGALVFAAGSGDHEGPFLMALACAFVAWSMAFGWTARLGSRPFASEAVKGLIGVLGWLAAVPAPILLF